jgi:hypothetical protein
MMALTCMLNFFRSLIVIDHRFNSLHTHSQREREKERERKRERERERESG